jgi:hypothetical protein
MVSNRRFQAAPRIRSESSIDMTTAVGRRFLVMVTGARCAASRSCPNRFLASIEEIVRVWPS